MELLGEWMELAIGEVGGASGEEGGASEWDWEGDIRDTYIMPA